MTEKFDENIMRVIKFAFRLYCTNGTGNEPMVDATRTDINVEDIDYFSVVPPKYPGVDPASINSYDISKLSFWECDFKYLVSSIFFWQNIIWQPFYEHNTLDLTEIEIDAILNNELMMADNDERFHVSNWATRDHNIGHYIYRFYHAKYKNKIRQWAEDEFVFSPK